MAKKKSGEIDIRASTGERDTFGILYAGTLRHPKFLALSKAAQRFYMICRAHANSKESRQCLHQHAKEFGLEEYDRWHFVFPASHMALYGIKRSDGCKYFKELEQAGFIRKAEANKKQWQVNVYEFVSNWKIDKPKI